MASRYNLKYEYSIDSRKTWTEITDFVDSAQTEITYNLCSTEFKSAKDKASFYLPATDSDAKETFMQALYDVDTIYVRISQKSDSTLLFLGIVDKTSLSIRSVPLAPSLTISLEDISSAKLDDEVDVNVSLWDEESNRLTVSRVVRYLVTLAGYEYTTNTIRSNEEVILPCFVIDKDNAKTYREYIDTLLFEVGGYVLDFNTEGKADIVRLDWSDANSKYARAVDNVRTSNGISTKTSVLKNDGIKVTWATIAESAKDQVVYQDSISRSTDDSGYLVGDDVVNGGYWPDDGDITATYQEFSADFLDKPYLIQDSRKKNEDLTILAVKDVYAYIQATDKDHKAFTNWTYPVLPSLGMEKNPAIWPTKAWYLLRNDSGSTVNLQFFNLYGTVVYRSKINEMMTPESTKDPKEYTSTYIYESAHAKRFSQFYWHFLNTTRFISDWKEINNGTLGEVVRLTHKGMTFGQDALVVSKKVKWLNYDTQDVSLTAVGISEYNAYTSKGTSSIQGRTAKIGKDGTSGKDGASVEVQYAYSESFTELKSGDTSWGEGDIFWGGKDVTWITWSTTAPAEKEGYYIWIRTRVGNGEWQYSRLTGAHAQLCEITCDKSVVIRNDRLTTSEVYTFTADIQGYINKAVKIYLNGEDKTSVCTKNGHKYILVVSVPHANATSMTAIVCLDDVEMDSVTLSVTDETLAECYYGALDAAPTQYSENLTLAKGDWYFNTETKLVYTLQNAKTNEWQAITADDYITSLDFKELAKISSCITDMVKYGTTGSTTATLLGVFSRLSVDTGFIDKLFSSEGFIGELTSNSAVIDKLTSNTAFLESLTSSNGFITKLTSNSAFIKLLKIYSLFVGQGSRTSGFYVEISNTNEQTGESEVLFNVWYNGAKVFSISPTNGNVYLGSNFYYQASDATIRSTSNNVVIASNGQLTATNATLTSASVAGTINASKFKYGDVNVYFHAKTYFSSVWNLDFGSIYGYDVAEYAAVTINYARTNLSPSSSDGGSVSCVLSDNSKGLQTSSTIIDNSILTITYNRGTSGISLGIIITPKVTISCSVQLYK